MDSATVSNALKNAMNTGTRIAVGFSERSFFIDAVQTVEETAVDNGVLFEVVGLVYDTGHSRQATPERVWFESNHIVSIAVPVETESEADG